MTDTTPSPAVIEATGHMEIRGEPRADGYRPIADSLWVWATLLGAPPPDATRLVFAGARRLDAGHLQLTRVREGIERLTDGSAPIGSPAGRALVHEVVGDAELAIIALDMALTIAAGLCGRYQVAASVPSLVTAKKPLVARLRDHYSHIDERALGRVKGAPDAAAQAAFHHAALIDSREYTDGTESLNIDQEATDLFVATRAYFVAAWAEIVSRVAKPTTT